MNSKAALGLACLLLAAATVSAQSFTISKDTSCKYLDEGYVRSSGSTGVYEVRIPVHTEEANDLVNYYLGQINVAQLEDATTSCAGLSLGFGTNANFYPTGDVKWYRIPVTAASSKQSEETDFDFKVNANQVFVYLAIRTAAPSSTATTYSPNLQVNSWDELFAMSAFNTVNNHVGNNYGMVINRNGDTVHIMLVQPYQLSPSMLSPIAATSTNCPKGTTFYTNCAIRYGKLRGPTPANGIGPYGAFFSTFKINFILWWMVITTLFYFFWALGSDSKDLLQPDHEDNRFFNHPFYSSWVFGTELQTKVSRITMIYVSLATMLFACCFMHYYLRNESIGTRVGAAIPVGLAFSWVMVHFISYFLNKLKASHYDYMAEMKKADTHDKRLDIENGYDNNRSKWNFLFYGFSFLIVNGAYWGGIGLTINFNNTRFWWLMLSYGIVIFGEFLLLDYVVVALGKGEGGLAKWVQSRGYFIDYKLHREWDDFQASQE